MGADPADIAERLSGIAEELADLALDRLRQASDSVRAGGEPDPAVTAEEKRITRARRSVEKAVPAAGRAVVGGRLRRGALAGPSGLLAGSAGLAGLGPLTRGLGRLCGPSAPPATPAPPAPACVPAPVLTSGSCHTRVLDLVSVQLDMELAVINEVLDRVGEWDPAALADTESIVALERMAAHAEAIVTRAVAAFDTSGNWAPDGAQTAATWITPSAGSRRTWRGARFAADGSSGLSIETTRAWVPGTSPAPTSM